MNSGHLPDASSPKHATSIGFLLLLKQAWAGGGGGDCFIFPRFSLSFFFVFPRLPAHAPMFSLSNMAACRARVPMDTDHNLASMHAQSHTSESAVKKKNDVCVYVCMLYILEKSSIGVAGDDRPWKPMLVLCFACTHSLLPVEFLSFFPGLVWFLPHAPSFLPPSI